MHIYAIISWPVTWSSPCTAVCTGDKPQRADSGSDFVLLASLTVTKSSQSTFEESVSKANHDVCAFMKCHLRRLRMAAAWLIENNKQQIQIQKMTKVWNNFLVVTSSNKISKYDQFSYAYI